MRVQSILSIVAGMFFCAFGAIFGLGSYLNMVEPEKSHQVVTFGIMLLLFGLLPFAVGVAAIVYGWRSNKRRHFETRERELLGLAMKNGGKVTVPQATMAMNLTSSEVKVLLDQCHASGLADLSVSEDGEVEYWFFGAPKSVST